MTVLDDNDASSHEVLTSGNATPNHSSTHDKTHDKKGRRFKARVSFSDHLRVQHFHPDSEEESVEDVPVKGGCFAGLGKLFKCF